MLKYSVSAIINKNKGLQFKWSLPSRYDLGRGGVMVKGQVHIFSKFISKHKRHAHMYSLTVLAAEIVPPVHISSKEIPSISDFNVRDWE